MKSFRFPRVAGTPLLLLWFQVAQTNPGFVTGIVRTEAGAPAPRVRVYAISVGSTTDANTTPSALESQTETDAAGRYRLELRAGSYHIASGAVSSPTYFPGAREVGSARVVTVGAGETVTNIDFAGFVNRPTGTLQIARGTAVLSGVIRYPDGAPAVGLPVIAVPTAGATIPTVPVPLVAMPGGTTTINIRIAGTSLFSTFSDTNGRYRLENLPVENFFIVSGYADTPTLYPGAPNLSGAQAIATTPTTNTSTMDFIVRPVPPTRTVRGKVSTSGNVPATGASVRLRPVNPASPSFGLPLRIPTGQYTAGADGSFEIAGVSQGTYVVEATYGGTGRDQRTVTVSDRDVTDLQLSLPVASFSGRILMENGSTPLNVQAFEDAILTTVNEPNMISSTILSIATDGSFHRLMEQGRFRFYLRSIPEEYEIRSMRWGDLDLLQHNVEITGKEAVSVEVRVAQRTAATASANRVSGTWIALAGSATSADRLTLCCLTAGPAERLATQLRSNGSFEFANVPPGRYSLRLQSKGGLGQRNPLVAPNSIEVPEGGLSDVQLVSAPEMRIATITLTTDDLRPLPEDARPTIVWRSESNSVRVVSEKVREGFYSASLPVGLTYRISVENLPEGYVVKTPQAPISVTTDAIPAFNAIPGISPTNAVAQMPTIFSITVGRN